MTFADVDDALNRTSVHYSASKCALATKRPKEAADVLKTRLKGYINELVVCWKMKFLASENQVINSENISYLRQICQYFMCLQSSNLDEF